VAVGLALDVWPDLIVSPRVLTILFGIALVVTWALPALLLFRSETVASATAVLVACYPDRVVLAAVGLAEVMFQEFIGLAVIFLLLYFRDGQTGHLLAAGLFLASDGSLRGRGLRGHGGADRAIRIAPRRGLFVTLRRSTGLRGRRMPCAQEPSSRGSWMASSIGRP
jgi:hypothetical protein